MARIPTFIPESIANAVGGIFSGATVDVVWKVFVGAMFVALILVLAQLGFFGAAIAGALFTTLFSDDVRALVADVWDRNFWVWRV